MLIISLFTFPENEKKSCTRRFLLIFGPTHQTPDMNILIVEDDPFVAEDLKEKLEKLQHHVTDVAESYDAALESIRKNKPDLALVDIELKGELTGIDLSEQLQRLAIPFLYLSGLEELDIYYKAEKTGRLQHLPKPIGLLHLRNALLDAQAVVTAAQRDAMRFFTVKAGTRKCLDPNQVVYLKADRVYCEVHFKDGSKWELSMNMGKVAEKLDHPDFIQIHRSHFVNKKHIALITTKTVQLTTGVVLKIADSYKVEINRAVNII
jgi:DNA-binding LytR/AlgR family response regulator